MTTKTQLEALLTLTIGRAVTLAPVEKVPVRAVQGPEAGGARLYYVSRRGQTVRTTTTYLFHPALGRFLVRTKR